jgi:hypothetical protein
LIELVFMQEWYILIEGQKEGPFTIKELKKDFRVTPDTLVWKPGFSHWLPIRNVPELKELFEDIEEIKPIEKEPLIQGQEALCITTRKDPNFIWVLLLLILVIILLYLFNQT